MCQGMEAFFVGGERVTRRTLCNDICLSHAFRLYTLYSLLLLVYADMWKTEMSMPKEISYIERLDTFPEIRAIRTKPFLGLDEVFVDGCGLPRQMKREAHGLSRGE